MVSIPAIIRPAGAQRSRKLVIATWGGAGIIAQKKFLWSKFTEETGIEIVEAAGPDLAKIKAQVKSKDVEWDLANLVDSWVRPGEREELYERIDTSVVPVERLYPAARREFMIGSHFYAGGLGYRSDFESGNPADTWQKFWNVGGFPGRRALRNRIGETLEVALLADGVPASQVYPCDVDRAFKALDRIKPHARHWVSQTPQTTQLLQNGECNYSYTYSNSIFAARTATPELRFSRKNQLIAPNWIGVLKGSRNKDAAMKYLEFATRTQPQMDIALAVGNAPSAIGVGDRLPGNVRDLLPNMNDESCLNLNTDWWGDNLDELTKRFNAWLLN